MRQFSLALVILASALAISARAADIRTLKVENHQDRYTIAFDALLDAPHDFVYTAISSPVHWPQLSSIVTTAEVLRELPGDRREINVIFKDCILIFCQTVHKHETLYVTADGNIETQAIPEQSDFSYAREHWRITGVGRRTRVQYQAEMTPTFFIPPVIGAYIIKAKIRSLLLHVTAKLEALSGP